MPVRSVASIRRSPSNLKPGASVPCNTHWRIVYLDGVHFSIRHGDKADLSIIVTALGVDMTGNKRGVGIASVRRRKQGGMARSLAGSAQTRGQRRLISSSLTGTMDCSLPSWYCLCQRLANVVSCISSAMCSRLSPDESAAMSKPNWWASGNNRPSRKHWPNWPHSKPNTGKRYPEAVRSLAEEEREDHSPFTSFLRNNEMLHSDHCMLLKASLATCGSAPIRLMCSRPKRVA